MRGIQKFCSLLLLGLSACSPGAPDSSGTFWNEITPHGSGLQPSGASGQHDGGDQNCRVFAFEGVPLSATQIGEFGNQCKVTYPWIAPCEGRACLIALDIGIGSSTRFLLNEEGVVVIRSPYIQNSAILYLTSFARLENCEFLIPQSCQIGEVINLRLPVKTEVRNTWY